MDSKLTCVFLVLVMALAPIIGLVENTNQLDDISINRSGSADGSVDISSWRIGDTWVYDTQFDVAQLIAQAEVSASLNTLTGDTDVEVVDIYFIDINGTTTLVYEVEYDGDFSSGNSGATLEGVSGRLDISYDGTDVIRVRDNAVVSSEFSLGVDFYPFNIGFLRQDIADLTFNTTYDSPKEHRDFPMRYGDQWYKNYEAATIVSGSSDYFDPSLFDTTEQENTSWQITKEGVPTENGASPSYSGCDDSYKLMQYNTTGVNTGFEWYCPAVRNYAWLKVINSAGFEIDWLLKRYSPSDSFGVDAASDPGQRNVVIDIDLQYLAVLPNSEEYVNATYETAQGQAQTNKNLQLRYESAQTIVSPTTNSFGETSTLLNVSDEVDNSPSSDDHTSNGVIVWDPQQEIIGVATIWMDLSLVAVDLVAQTESVIVERTRDNQTITLTQSIGFNALPGDVLSFSLPAQNRGLLASVATEIEVLTPDGVTTRQLISSIGPYSEQRALVEWTVPEGSEIGTQTVQFSVDPDGYESRDANLSNNVGQFDIFIGRAPTGVFTAPSGFYTFDNVTLDASSSFDEDGGDVSCLFEIESRPGLIDRFDEEDCLASWNWSNGGEWTITITVTDDELDTYVIMEMITILNRAPYANLTHPESVLVESPITIDASDSGDVDTVSPLGQDVIISWPGLTCQEGTTQDTCTFTPTEEGETVVTAKVTDDDGESIYVNSTFMVLNKDPTVSAVSVVVNGIPIDVTSQVVNVEEDQEVTLVAQAIDSLNDLDDIVVEWTPSDRDTNWTVSTIGADSSVDVSWSEPGQHIMSVRAYDDDGSSSESTTAVVNVLNVDPEISGLMGDRAIFEDEMVNLSVSVSDTPSDVEELVICWDLNTALDSDANGFSDDDCDRTGLFTEVVWTTSGIRNVRAWVTDDNGAFAEMFTNLSVVNARPTADISNITDITVIYEGDSINLTAVGSSDTPGDRASLIFSWDASSIPGGPDATNEVFEITNLPLGTVYVNLTVIDDDGETNTDSFTFEVIERPSTGLISTLEDNLGSKGAAYAVLVFVPLIFVLGTVLLLSRRKSEDDLPVLESFLPPGGMPTGAPPAPLKETPAIPVPDYSAQPEGYVQDQSVSAFAQTNYQTQSQTDFYQQAPALQPEPVAPAGPPLPSTGLPDGWTMEQWNHYGQQWLDANPQLAVQPASQPADPFAALQPNPVQDVAVNTQPVETYAAQPAVEANPFGVSQAANEFASPQSSNEFAIPNQNQQPVNQDNNFSDLLDGLDI